MLKGKHLELVIERTLPSMQVLVQLINREDGKPSGPAAELEESSLMDSTIMDSENSMSER